MRELYPATIIYNQPIAPGAWLLSFRRTFDFIAGQVVGITINPDSEPRLYSIASAAKQDEIWILYTLKEEGLLTPPLSQLKSGDKILITRPFGNFICKEKEAVWIATGTGIAPFASMFFSGLHPGKTLIQGSQNLERMYFYEHFSKTMGLNYHPCCSRETTTDCFKGRVTEFLEQQPDIKTGIPYYLCGIAEMVVDVRDALIARGVPFSNINSEIFF